MCPALTDIENRVRIIAESSGSAGTQGGEVASAEYSVDESEPSTSVQIRTASGGRIIAKFNNSSTIADLKRSAPGLTR